MPAREHARARTGKPVYRFFFLCRFFRKRFFRLWVAILWRFRFLPQGILLSFFSVFQFLQLPVHGR